MKIEYSRYSYHRIFDAAETEQLFVPIVDKVFVPDDHPNSLAGPRPFGSEIFNNADWKIIGLAGDPWYGYVNSSPRALPETCVQVDRETGHWDTLRPLYMALVERGIDEVIHMNPFELLDGGGRGSNGAITHLPITEGASRALFPEGPAGIFGLGCMISRDGDWGLIADEDSVSILGGEPEFMDRVIELAGGEDFLRAEFDEFWIDRYVMSAPLSHDWTFACYDCIGWPVPDIIRNLEPGQSLDRSHLSWINDVADKGTE
jgi:hypothetical protein